MYRASISVRNFFDMKRYTKTVKHLIGLPPITGTSGPPSILVCAVRGPTSLRVTDA